MVAIEITSCTDSGERPLQVVSYEYATSTGNSARTEPARAPFWTVGVFALFLAAGTGGSVSTASASAVAEIDSARTGSSCRIECVSKTRREDEEDRIEGSTQALSVLQHCLSLNLSELVLLC